jgi:hypothetical protein
MSVRQMESTTDANLLLSICRAPSSQRLAALLPNSRFYLRQHGFDGWETVVYVVPQK